jgi:hypothetical protein
MNSDSGNKGLAWQSGVWDKMSLSGIQAQVEGQLLNFEFDDFDSAWDVLAGVTTASLAPDVQEQAKNAVRDLMRNDVTGPRSFQNKTQFITGRAQ